MSTQDDFHRTLLSTKLWRKPLRKNAENIWWRVSSSFQKNILPNQIGVENSKMFWTFLNHPTCFHKHLEPMISGCRFLSCCRFHRNLATETSPNDGWPGYWPTARKDIADGLCYWLVNKLTGPCNVFWHDNNHPVQSKHKNKHKIHASDVVVFCVTNDEDDGHVEDAENIEDEKSLRQTSSKQTWLPETCHVSLND